MVELESESLTTKALLSDIQTQAKQGSEEAAEFAKQLEFFGKTLDEWSAQLSIFIPKDPPPPVLRALFVDLANKIQIASHHCSIASAINTAIENSSRMKKSDLVTTIATSYEKRNAKRPAGTVIERMADSYMRSAESTKAAARIVKDFWRLRMESLVEVRKILEQISILQSVEIKYMETA